MPIYQGGKLFLEGLDSVERIDVPFNKIIISFNGNSSTDYDLFCREVSRGRFCKDYTVFRTKAEMNSLDHSIFITESLKKLCVAGLKVFLLAHDDRILNSRDDKDLYDFLENTNSETVYFPSYSCCFENEGLSIFKVIESNRQMSSNDFFWTTQRQDVPTNMSGMIIPLDSWIETIKVLKKAGSGARFEHLLCIARCISNVCFSDKVRVLVVSRSNSEADNLKAMQHRVSALYYTVTFFNNGRVADLTSLFLYGFILLKKMMGVIIQYFKDKLSF
jgi:hypothetical protein